MSNGTDDQISKGTANRCPCPWCAEVMDDLESLGDDLKVGAVLECSFCSNLFELTAVNEVIHVRTQRHGAMRSNTHLK
jgi:hypothetical protein